ncbi:MAG TPA: STAS domain-containing protein [Roseiflexaceae bacterium]|nr:STAS domain-containing protein [Roseiflexaceae bacterium]
MGLRIRITQRQTVLGLLAIMTVCVLLIMAGLLTTGAELNQMIPTAVALLISGGLWVAYWRGWEPARYLAVIMFTLLAAVGTPEPYVSQTTAFSTFVPPILALVLASPIWVIGSAVVLIGVLIARAGGGVYADPVNLAIFSICIGGMIIARLITEENARRAQENAQQADAHRATAQAQAQELADANELMTEQLDQQSKLLSLVATLETPVVPLAEGMLLAPLVGHMDSRRAEELTKRLLQEANSQRAKLVVLDIAGVSVMDTSVAKAVIHAVHALRLLGCEVALSGISASVAMSLIHLGVNLDDVKTVRSPQEVLANYLGGAETAAQRTWASRLTSAAAPLNTNGNGHISHN